MAKPLIPAGLPDSALLRALAKKTAVLKTAQSEGAVFYTFTEDNTFVLSHRQRT
jgi:hypothetical protein